MDSSEDEVFFGPRTEKERIAERRLPRKTIADNSIHLCLQQENDVHIDSCHEHDCDQSFNEHIGRLPDSEDNSFSDSVFTILNRSAPAAIDSHDTEEASFSEEPESLNYSIIAECGSIKCPEDSAMSNLSLRPSSLSNQCSYESFNCPKSFDNGSCSMNVDEESASPPNIPLDEEPNKTPLNRVNIVSFNDAVSFVEPISEFIPNQSGSDVSEPYATCNVDSKFIDNDEPTEFHPTITSTVTKATTESVKVESVQSEPNSSDSENDEFNSAFCTALDISMEEKSALTSPINLKQSLARIQTRLDTLASKVGLTHEESIGDRTMCFLQSIKGGTPGIINSPGRDQISSLTPFYTPAEKKPRRYIVKHLPYSEQGRASPSSSASGLPFRRCPTQPSISPVVIKPIKL